jgi:hypothetical protein
MNVAFRTQIPAAVQKAFSSFADTGSLDPAAVRGELAEQDLYTAVGLGVFAQDVASMDEKAGIDKAMGKPGVVEINRADVPPNSDAASFPYQTVEATYSGDMANGPQFQMTSAVTTDDNQVQYLFFQAPGEGSARYAVATVHDGKTSIEAGYINQNPGHEAAYKETLNF